MTSAKLAGPATIFTGPSERRVPDGAKAPPPKSSLRPLRIWRFAAERSQSIWRRVLLRPEKKYFALFHSTAGSRQARRRSTWLVTNSFMSFGR